MLMIPNLQDTYTFKLEIIKKNYSNLFLKPLDLLKYMNQWFMVLIILVKEDKYFLVSIVHQSCIQ